MYYTLSFYLKKNYIIISYYKYFTFLLSIFSSLTRQQHYMTVFTFVYSLVLSQFIIIRLYTYLYIIVLYFHGFVQIKPLVYILITSFLFYLISTFCFYYYSNSCLLFSFFSVLLVFVFSFLFGFSSLTESGCVSGMHALLCADLQRKRVDSVVSLKPIPQGLITNSDKEPQQTVTRTIDEHGHYMPIPGQHTTHTTSSNIYIY